MGKKSKIRGGDLIGAPGALDRQIEGAAQAKARSQERTKAKRKRDDEEKDVSVWYGLTPEGVGKLGTFRNVLF